MYTPAAFSLCRTSLSSSPCRIPLMLLVTSSWSSCTERWVRLIHVGLMEEDDPHQSSSAPLHCCTSVNVQLSSLLSPVEDTVAEVYQVGVWVMKFIHFSSLVVKTINLQSSESAVPNRLIIDSEMNRFLWHDTIFKSAHSVCLMLLAAINLPLYDPQVIAHHSFLIDSAGQRDIGGFWLLIYSLIILLVWLQWLSVGCLSPGLCWWVCLICLSVKNGFIFIGFIRLWV